jgi:hypothetical protein
MLPERKKNAPNWTWNRLLMSRHSISDITLYSPSRLTRNHSIIEDVERKQNQVSILEFRKYGNIELGLESAWAVKWLAPETSG